MAQSVPVVVMVDPSKETVIKPFAGQIAKAPPLNQSSSAAPAVTGSGTVTYNGELGCGRND
jgi:hypothetical protein